MGALSIAAVLAANDQVIEAVPVPEWGGEVFVRSLKSWERDQYDSERFEASEKKDFAHLRARLVARAWCNEKGEPEAVTPAMVLSLSDKNAAAMDRIYDVAAKLAGIIGGDTNTKTVTVPADSEKNLSGQSGDSG